MRHATPFFAFLTLCLILGLGVGCKAKVEQSTATDSDVQALAQKFPDGPSVLTALEQKDYDAAVAALAKVQQALPEGELVAEYAGLKQHVKNTLMDASTTDPKAQAALDNLRLLTQGR